MRERSSGQDRGDDWIPPLWTHPVETAPVGPSRPPGRFYQPELTRRIDISGSGAIVALAIAPAATGLAAFVFGLLPMFSSAASTVPRGMLGLLILQFGGLMISRFTQSPALVLSWTASLFVSCLLTPILALQVTLLREPYVSFARDSATPALFATLVSVMMLGFATVWCVVVAWSDPDQAALLFMPAGLLWPVMIGIGAVVTQRSALIAIGEVSLICAAATAFSVVLPPFSRIFVPAGAMALEFVFLWLTGRGPRFEPTSGGVVRAIYMGSLALTALLIVAAPLIAMRAGTFLARRQSLRSRLADGSLRK